MKLAAIVLLLLAFGARQACAAEYHESIPYLDDPSHASITFTKAPAPSVYASAAVSSTAQGQMVYTFDVNGAQPDSYVPVNFAGTYKMVFQGDVPGLGQGRWSMLGASFYSGYFDVDGGFHFEGVKFSAGCNRINTGGCDVESLGSMPPSTYSKIELSNTKIGAASILGEFGGTLYIPINSKGDAVGVVNLFAFAGSFGLQSTSFIDPRLQIDEAWLAAHPGVTITLPDGVGNATSPVPEPSSYLLLLAGLCLIGGVFTRRSTLRRI
ncbi:PEP-CTERM sorting domain-containing protein [Roseateles albus]|uniref:PEP-CTERM sorting domain-containing protein n=1 Tax=Roseateles albus TaxID=2987525 RepID=A0ABT5KNI6_9BURK|nr:PEP-CTERM sorting domain-containing protein [Roseateles albus]MDC8774465.1 PEP-CTERM sorting domain-containing protein [Roseateles albus]